MSQAQSTWLTLRHQNVPTSGLFFGAGAGFALRALPIRSSSELLVRSLPERTVTLNVVATRACLVSLTLRLSVRFWAGLSDGSVLTLRTESPRALPRLTVTLPERLEPSLATLSFRVIVRLRRIVDGAPSSETVSLAAFATGTGGTAAVVVGGAGTGVGAVVAAGVGVAAGGASGSSAISASVAS